MKEQYRELFSLAHQHLQDVFKTLHAQYTCDQCQTQPEDVLKVLHAGCGYRQWQKAVVFHLEKVTAKGIVESIAKVKAAREVKGACHSCGVCCDLASSEFDYDTLLEKAKNGDPFASQFTRVFLPYASQKEAQTRYPDIVNDILTQTEDPVYFYRCPYLSEDKRCTIYTHPHRPDLCATYPETPLILMYKGCGYQPWKQEMLPSTLLSHATLELCQHYAFKILDAVKA
jgi:Fe-S-cluster containining protein